MSSAAELAGRGRRLVATLIDAALVPSLTIFITMAAGVLEDAEDYTSNTWMLWVFLFAVLSYLLLNGVTLIRRGQTLGKRVMGIAIVCADTGDQVPWWRLILVRAWAFPLLFTLVVPWIALVPLIDHLMIFRKSRRTLHDMLAGTLVVRR